MYTLITFGVPVLLLVQGELQPYIPPGKLCEGIFKSAEKAEEVGRKKTKYGGTFEIIYTDGVVNLGD